MPKVKVEKIIKAERGKVFSTITDFENLPSFQNSSNLSRL